MCTFVLLQCKMAHCGMETCLQRSLAAAAGAKLNSDDIVVTCYLSSVSGLVVARCWILIPWPY